jgi:hypothetical protein
MAKDNDKNDITLTVVSGRGSREFTFPKQTKVQDVALHAAIALGYPPGGVYTIVWLRSHTEQEELQGDRPLVSYHVGDGTRLALSETGSGV